MTVKTATLELCSIPSESWRSSKGAPPLDEVESWRRTREIVLERDNHTCAYCGFRSPKYMEIHHLKGRHEDDSPENLACLCPLCHACLHIGFSGAVRRGVLLVLDREKTCDQAELNRFLLEAARKRNPSLWRKKLQSLEARENRGADGLAMLGDLIAMSGKTPPGNLVFFPNAASFPIIAWLAGGNSFDDASSI